MTHQPGVYVPLRALFLVYHSVDSANQLLLERSVYPLNTLTY